MILPPLPHDSSHCGALCSSAITIRQSRCAFCQPPLFLTLFAAASRRGCRAVAGAAAGRHSARPAGILHAQLYKPDGDGPFPTVIALHGCGGLGGHSEPVLPRYRDWAEQLLKAGNAVLLPDSYGSRELGPQCRVKERTRAAPAASASPTSRRRGNGWCSSPGSRATASA